MQNRYLIFGILIFLLYLCKNFQSITCCFSEIFKTFETYKTFLTINFTIMAYVISEDCIACGTCIDECPMGAISEGDIYVIDADACTECGTCADVCPSGAISQG